MATFKPNVLAVALAAAGLTMSALPMQVLAAQEAAKAADQTDADKAKNDDVEVIEVTGFRASLQRSQAIKQTNTSIVEAISAEDIGKLPDSSIAESIARLPGLAAQRLDGRASGISVRGLSEDFSTVTFNGREQVSIGDGRGVEMDLYPSEIMNAVVVYKTPDASLTSQGIAGTIDLQSVRPLKQDKRSFSANLTGEKNDIGKLNPDGKDKGWRSSVSYIDQFADDTIGVALAYAHMDSPNNERRWNSWGFANDDDGNLVLGGAKPYVRSSELKRDTVMGVLEFAPNDRFHATLDAMHIDFKDEKRLRGIEIPAFYGQGTIENLQVVDGFVTQGIIHDQRVVIRNDYDERNADLDSLGLNLEYNLGDNWQLAGDLSYSKVERDIFSLESYSGTGRGNDNGVADDIGFTLNGGAEGAHFDPTLDYSDPSLIMLGGPLSWGNGIAVPSDGQDGFINRPEIDDEIKAAKFSAVRFTDNDIVSSVKFGVHYSERTKTREDHGTYLTLKAYPAMLPVPAEYLLAPTSLDFIGMGNMLSYDSKRLYDDGFYNGFDQGATEPDRARNSWEVEEKVTTGFVMANIDSTLLGLPVKGNVGAQYVHTNQRSLGNQVTVVDGATQIDKIDRGTSYNEFLPSLNLSFEVADQQFVRFGAARTLTRSRMDRMNASYGYSFNPALNVANAPISNSPWSGGGGNPELKPYIANQYDLSYENYFAGQGYFSAAIFYKDLKNWQFNVSSIEDFSDVPPLTTGDVYQYKGVVTRWENTEGGYIKGAEFTLSLPGELLSDYLEGFGAILSATYNTSAVSFAYPSGIDANDNVTYDSTNIQVPGLSRQIYNATFFYEKNGFQIRTSMRKRSDFNGEVSGLSFSRTPVNVKGEEIWDAQISYDFSESGIDYLDGLTIMLQGQNLTDEPFTTTEPGDDRQVRDYQLYGRNYLLGLSYKF
nr:TonB-dependent receptor [Gallaecimonas xiamenensis]